MPKTLMTKDVLALLLADKAFKPKQQAVTRGGLRLHFFFADYDLPMSEADITAASPEPEAKRKR